MNTDFENKALCICPWCGSEMEHQAKQSFQCTEDSTHTFTIEVHHARGKTT